MTYVRVTRDQRGYETTLLLHTPHLGDRPKVLYWYRTAPGVRVGRPALDEEAIRAIEELHPDIEFDWPQLLEEASTSTPEVERRPERRRKPVKPREGLEDQGGVVRGDAFILGTQETVPPLAVGAEPSSEGQGFSPGLQPQVPGNQPQVPGNQPQVPGNQPQSPGSQGTTQGQQTRNQLLDQLVGREIATRLRARYAEISDRILQVGDENARAQWQTRADALDPDRWTTPEAILHGVQHADRLLDELRRELR